MTGSYHDPVPSTRTPRSGWLVLRHPPWDAPTLMLGLALALGAGCNEASSPEPRQSDDERKAVADPGTPPADAACAKNDLGKLAASVRTGDPRAAGASTVEGLAHTCASQLPAVFGFYDPEVVDTPGDARPGSELSITDRLRPICSDYPRAMTAMREFESNRADVLFEACGFERYGVVVVGEANPEGTGATPWVLHQWLLDRGARPEDARVLTRGLLLHDAQLGRSPRPRPGQTLPSGQGRLPRDGIDIAVTPSELVYVGERIATLSAGSLDGEDLAGGTVTPLFRALMEEAERADEVAGEFGRRNSERLIIAADRSTDSEVLLAILRTASQLEFERAALVSEGPWFLPSHFRFILAADLAAPFPPSATRTEKTLRVDLFEDRVELHPLGGDVGEAAATFGARETDRIQAQVAAARKADPNTKRAVLALAPGVDVQRIVDTMRALQGGDCREVDKCVIEEMAVSIHPLAP